jgi:predicted Rossmann fold nucleotide-binding protein DprA/Smf involved in DNA uptake
MKRQEGRRSMKTDQGQQPLVKPGPEVEDMMRTVAKMAEELSRMSGVIQQLQRRDPSEVAVTRPRRAREYPVEVPVPEKPLDIKDQIAAALTRESLNTQQLAKTIGETVEHTSDLIKVLRAEGKIYNIGYEDSAIWTWKLNNDVDSDTLHRVVKRLISERPMWSRDIVRATGVREARVQTALIELQRTHKVIDLSGGGHAKKYFLIGENAFDASLPPKTNNGRVVRHGGRREARREAKDDK